ncbi:MAG: RtcB family protein [Cytophagales bacterium]|jgi:tRNA-splicing ligase RtcB|nr:RtcB family protein [Cytophagales bacterium]MCA6386957.1 RtcB family protein [Cytophagales bacterium]MCA6392264.1 RtcB family protein [Cytophagales bacterium]MCA6394524.1 RtcB family protein [Cytophagales bacterium]MCA6399635.1 RtcB family protein [Cytophagales bacterium]
MNTITGNDLINIGFTESKALGIALLIVENKLNHLSKEEQLTLLAEVVKQPAVFENDPILLPLVQELNKPASDVIELNGQSLPYAIYGAEAIEEGALKQMQIAMKLPITVAGALMPDAHQGYGLPIGGVLATRNAVIPYGVGVDIGCRMCMTIYDLPTVLLEDKKEDLKKMLLNNTQFGQATFKKPKDHEIFERNEFKELSIVREMKDRAWKQIGSSGGGNHFVEFGMVEIQSVINEYNLAPGMYVAVLSHSGSRGLGANIARHYTHIAMDVCKLPQEAKHLAWLDLATEVGQEYWLAMNLAGDYASACHHQIHERMAIGLRETPLAMIENHHNFAWKEKDTQGNELIVHRKGATPAGAGVLGIIPGSMATPGFIVRGKGLAASINSASHGAGRLMSRTKAKETILPGHVNKFLKQAGVELIGSGLDEAPMAYKDIHQVMASQKDLVEVLGSFMPKIVRMCGDERFQEVD